MRNLLALIALLAIASLLKAQDAYSFDSQLTQDWFGTECYLVKNGTGFTPPVASRAFGYAGLAVYEALVPGMSNRMSLQTQLGYTVTGATPGTAYHWPTVANNCLALIVDSLWGNASQPQKDSIHALRDRYNAQYMSQGTYADSKAFGEAVATDIYGWSMTDGGHQGYAHNTDAGYVPPTGPGLWVPTPPAFAMALQPHWGDNRPFVAANVALPVVPVAPPVYSTDTNSAFYAYAYQVYSTVNNLSAGQQNIAKYWADGSASVTPPGHSISILTQCLDDTNANLGWSAYAYAKLAMSQTDAFITCWKTKYIHNLLRPVTYIRANIDSTWSSFIGTPPFPEYTSGHSTQSGAMSAVMNDLFGPTYDFTDYTHGSNFGGPRFFSCFDEAAYEAATSRLYGGIHYEFSNVLAITLGKMVGDNINSLFEQVTVHNDADVLAAVPTVQFYPNPTPDYALISCQGFKMGKVAIYGMDGRWVAESRNTAVVDLMGLPAGQYILRVFDAKDQPVLSSKIVKI